MAVTINGSAGVTTNSGAVYNGISSGTAVSASGTSIDFTSIPSWVKRITVMFQGVSLSSTANLLIQIGAGSVTSSGYISTSNRMNQANSTAGASSTSGFVMFVSSAPNIVSGHMILTNITSNSWVSSHVGKTGTTDTIMGGGDVGLGGTLDRVRITSTSTDTFDAGSINILYE